MDATDVDDLSQRLEQKAVAVGAREPTDSKEDPCWDGYTMVGTKPNGDPRCVPDDDVDNYEGAESGISLAASAEVPMIDDAQILYPDKGQAGAAAESFGLTADSAHEHELDGETWYMPGESHDQFIAAVSGEATTQAAFADYEDFDACVRANSDKEDPEAYCASIKRQVEGKGDGDAETAAAVDQKAAFAEGDAVRWSWQGEPVHGRVAEVRPQQATVSGNTITGGDDESVYVIDEFDDRVGAYRRENVAKPGSSLDKSRKDLPPRNESNYVSEQAWESLTTCTSGSDFDALELDYIAREHESVLLKSRPGEWIMPGVDPVVYRADIPDKYLSVRDENFFVPNEGVADAARKVKGWRDEHGSDVAGGASDGEGTRRATQLIEHAERGESLAIDYWREIKNFHSRHRAQDSHELDADKQGEPWTDAGYVSDHNWGSDAGFSQAKRVMDYVDSIEQESTVELEGAVATEQTLSPEAITQADTNRVDVDALEGELRDAVEADDFYIYGKASIEQWDSDDPPTYIQMEALEGALDRFFDSTNAPGIISRHHQDIPVGRPVREFEFESDTTLEIGDDVFEFAAGDTVTSHVEDADGDGRPELWLAANIDGETEMGKKTRLLAAQGDLNGFSVTVHRNDDEMTQEGRVVTEADLHAVTIGTDEQIKNKGSEFDVASYKGPIERIKGVVQGLLR